MVQSSVLHAGLAQTRSCPHPGDGRTGRPVDAAAWLNAAVRLRLLSGQAFRKLIDGNLNETTWQKQVEEALTVCGWWWMHVPANVVVCPCCHTKIYRGIRKGFPDLFAIKPPHMFWLELKTERGRSSLNSARFSTCWPHVARRCCTRARVIVSTCSI